MEKLTYQEEEVMLIIWQVKNGVIKDFLNQMEEPKPPYTTVASIVKNLEKKGFLTSKKHGNIYEYMPLVDENDKVHVGSREKLFREFLQRDGDLFR